ncbi:MAG: DnaJ domain-containing protein [Armatimonadetes bacterium]|nr:DnaJ domain-containing protein [Armatimonadota bacterium]
MAYELYQTLELTPGATPEEIKRAYFRLVRRHPPEKDPETFKNIRAAYETLKDEKARRDYDDFQRHGDEITDLFSEAERLIQEEQWDDAIRPLKRLLVMAPGFDMARNHLGLCYFYREDWEGAKKIFQALTQRRPDVPLFWMNYGTVFLLEAQNQEQEIRKSPLLEQARALFQRAQQLESFNSEPYLAISQTFREEGRYSEALTWAERALSADGKEDFQDFDTLFEICIIHLRSGDPDQIEKTTTRIISLLPDDEDARKYAAYRFGRLAVDLDELRLYHLSSPLYQAALKFDPLNEDLQGLYEHSRNIAQALGEYDAFIADSSVVDYFRRLVSLYVSEASGTEHEDREEILEDIWAELDYHTPREVLNSVNRMKAQYPAIYALNDSHFDELADLARESLSPSSGSLSSPGGGYTPGGDTVPSSGGGCFVVTATYGSPEAAEVVRYRRYRDEVLVKTMLGRMMIRAYNRVGPMLARAVVRWSALKAIAAWVLGWLARHLPL